MNHERFEQITSSIQNITVTIAVIVGGIWAVYTFRSVGSVQRARLEIEQLSLRRPVVNLTVSSTLTCSSKVGLVGVPPAILQVDLKATNTGSIPTLLEVERGRITMSRLLGNYSQNRVGPDQYEVKLIGVSPRDLLWPGSSAAAVAIIPVTGPGIYLLQAQIPADEKVWSFYRSDTDTRDIKALMWGTQATVAIPDITAYCSATSTTKASASAND